MRYFQVEKEFVGMYSEKLADEKEIILSEDHEDYRGHRHDSRFNYANQNNNTLHDNPHHDEH